MNAALDEVRAVEARRMIQDGYEPVLKKSRWRLLKRPNNLTDNQRLKLRDVLRYNLKSVRAYLLKEEFQYFRARKEFSSGVIEGLNNKAKVIMRKAYGFRTFRMTELALYHVLGKLPEPKLTRTFY